jgi:hypothetical protein
VTRLDGSRIELTGPALRMDTLVGLRRGTDPRDSAAAMAAIPFSDIHELAVRRFDAGKTIALTAGIGLAIVIAAAAIDCCGPDFKNTDSLKSSPLVYSWDGHTWRLDSGTFAGAITAGAARADVDNLLYATAEGQTLRLRVANELQETDYLDALTLLAVDHERSMGVAPGSDGRLYSVGRLVPPARAADLAGRDALAAVRATDSVGWESVVTSRDPIAPADVRDGLELAFPRHGATAARLVVDAQNTPWVPVMLTAFVTMHGRSTQAWYDSLDSDPAQLASFGAMMAREGFLQVSVWSGDRWLPAGAIGAPGPELAKREVLPLDLSGVTGDTVRVRLESAPAFWWIDHVALDPSDERPVQARAIPPTTATDGQGRDLLPLLARVDQRYYVIETGEGAELQFDVPPVPAGRVRSYLVRSTGWYRIRAAAEGEAEVALLDKLLLKPGAGSRLSVERMNRVLQAATRPQSP